MCGLHPLCWRNDFLTLLTLFFFFYPSFTRRCSCARFDFYFVNHSYQWLVEICFARDYNLQTALNTGSTRGTWLRLAQRNPNTTGTGAFLFFLFHDECYQDATFDYSSFSNWDPFQARAISTPLNVLDRSNLPVLIERFLHWYNLPNGSRGTQRHQMCPGVPRNAPA